MDILFIHQNMPAQFKHLAPALAARKGMRVRFLTRREDIMLKGVERVTYAAPGGAGQATHPYLKQFEAAVRSGQQVARALLTMKKDGFDPAVVIGHPGWGELLYVKDVFPRASLISYAEFFYSGTGADVGFDPAQPWNIDVAARARTRNAHLLLSLQAADYGLAPTEWQKSRHPAEMQRKIRRIFDGIDTRQVAPRADASFTLDNGRVLTAADEVVTYIARNFEPYRGYPSFMRAVPHILAARPNAQLVMVGGDEVSYGAAPPGGGTWREAMAREVDLAAFANRVHVLGRVPYARHLSLLQISSAHVYLTVPFVLSWSAVEAMGCGCAVIASDTAPVQELVQHGANGWLVPFFDPPAIAAQVAEVLANRQDPAVRRVREAARQTVLGDWALTNCLPRQLALVQDAIDRR